MIILVSRRVWGKESTNVYQRSLKYAEALSVAYRFDLICLERFFIFVYLSYCAHSTSTFTLRSTVPVVWVSYIVYAHPMQEPA